MYTIVRVQQRPYWIPKNILDITTVFQLLATITITGTAIPKIHPTIIITLLPKMSPKIPTTKLAMALEIPKATKNWVDCNLDSTTNSPIFL